MAGENQGALSGVEQLDGTIEFDLIVALLLALDGQLGRGGVPIKFGGGLLRVFGNVDKHGTGAAGVGDYESFADGAGDIFGARNDYVVLGDGHGDAGDVDFLKSVGAEKFAGNLAGDADDGRGIEHGGGDAGDHVGSAGAGGGHRNAYIAAGTRVAVGHVCGTLFVAYEDVVKFRFAKRVIDRQDCAAGITEQVVHTELRQRLTKNFRTCQLHSVLPNCEALALWPARENDAGTTVMAPSEEEDTSRAYLANTPLVKRGAGGFHPARRC